MNQHRPWTKEEDATVKEMLRKGYRQIDVADKVHRTLAGVKCRIALLDLNRGRTFRNAKWWSPQEVELAQELLKDPKSDTMLLLGRTRQACYDKVKRRAQERLTPMRELFGAPCASAKVVIPPEVIDDRNRRLMAQRSLTAILMGDPEPNRRRA